MEGLFFFQSLTFFQNFLFFFCVGDIRFIFLFFVLFFMFPIFSFFLFLFCLRSFSLFFIFWVGQVKGVLCNPARSGCCSKLRFHLPVVHAAFGAVTNCKGAAVKLRHARRCEHTCLAKRTGLLRWRMTQAADSIRGIRACSLSVATPLNSTTPP